MNKNAAKNLIITVLVVLTFVQTVQLWFADSPNRPFLSGFFQNEVSASQAESVAKLVTPYRIMTDISDGGADKRLAVLYTGIETSALKKAGDSAIERVLKNGEYISSVPYSQPLTDKKYIEYDYAFSMPADVFVQHFKQKSNMLTSRVKQFDTIVIFPDDDGNRLTALFSDKIGGNSYQYSLAKADAGKELLNVINDTASSDNTLYCRLNAIDDNSAVYPAFWDGESYSYNNIAASNPYGEITLANVERSVNSFFSNPAAKQFQNKAGVFQFSDAKTVVYYNPNSVLEYSVYQSYSNEVVTSFIESFSVAMTILAKDKTIVNDFYLSGYERNEDGFVFTFDYCVNNFPLYFSQSLRTETEMNNMIEISVTKDSAKYKRYVSVYELSETVSYARNDFVSASESTFAIASETAETDNDEINLFDLAYKIDGGDTLYLSWFIDINGRTLVQSAE